METGLSQHLLIKIMEVNEQSPKEKNALRDYFKLGEVGAYFFRKKDPTRPTNFNIKVMHGINRISILVFLGALIIFLIRRFLMG
jgi:hypothetical protein